MPCCGRLSACRREYGIYGWSLDTNRAWMGTGGMYGGFVVSCTYFPFFAISGLLFSFCFLRREGAVSAKVGVAAGAVKKEKETDGCRAD